MTGCGSWGQQWSADDVAQLRSALGLSKLSFADRLRVHRRTASRWERGATAPTDHRVIEALDDLLCETVSELSPLLSPIQVRQMHRRDALRLLATGAPALGGVGGLWSDTLRRVDDRTLDHLEAVSVGLVGMFTTVPSGVLIGPVASHLEDATRLLALSMRPEQRQRLQAGIAEIALLVGNLASNAHRPAQASAYGQLAEDHAREAGDYALLATVLSFQSFLRSATPSGRRSPSPEAVRLLEQADALARTYAPAMVQTEIAARLAEERACAREAKANEEEFERAQQTLELAEREALPVSCSTVAYHALFLDEGLDGFRGICDILLDRPERAADALTSALAHVSWPRRQAIILTDLGAALKGQGEYPEASARLIEAHTVCVDHEYPMGLQRIYGVREQFPKLSAGLACVQELDERLRRA
ncbi:MAG: helix-turn-helix domain-containing protein [Pseudonocardiaceae bacterium]